MNAIRAGRLLGGVAAIAALAGCELASATIPRNDPALVVHAVLNPSSRVQYILVEESLAGDSAGNVDRRYDPGNPIATGYGIPVSGAIVTITDPDGLVMTATEFRPRNESSGVYQINLDDYSTALKTAQIQLGKRYHLSVSAQGMTVTGSTLVPVAKVPTFIPQPSFNRDRDSISIRINDVSLSRAFLVRLDAAIEAYQLFTFETEVKLAGDSRNIFTEDLVRVFSPGFLQTLTVAAVDTNVYDYYRSGNDPFSGTGLINHLSGGLGLFGSIVVADQRIFDITQDPTGDPLEGRYTYRGGGLPSSTRPTEITLFVEARGTNGNPDRITGSHLQGTSGSRRGAVYGTRSGDSVEFNLLVENTTTRFYSTFRGTAKGDSLLGSASQQPNLIYVRAGK